MCHRIQIQFIQIRQDGVHHHLDRGGARADPAIVHGVQAGATQVRDHHHPDASQATSSEGLRGPGHPAPSQVTEEEGGHCAVGDSQ